MAQARFVIAVVILMTFVYFVIADWLYMARLAGYICIAEMPDALTSSERLPAIQPQTSVDRDEPILSDIPNLAVET